MVWKKVKYTANDFDHFVSVLISRWGDDAEEYMSEWSNMHSEEQVIHAGDFGVNGTLFAHLRAYAETHELTAEQQRQYDHLLALMEKNRPKLRELGFLC